MRIGIDARPLSVEKFTGISFYEYMILKNWMEKHPEHEYYLFSLKPICWDEKDLPDNWHLINQPGLVKEKHLKSPWWFMFTVPRVIKSLKLDAYWGPNFSMPRKVKGVNYFVTIHDLGVYHFEHIGEKRNELQIKMFLPRNLRNAKRVFAISEFTKMDVMATFGTSEDKITTIYNGGPVENRKGKKGEEMVREEIKQLQDFFLFIGTIEPRKNIPTIIKGYETYMARYEKAENKKHATELVLAGGKGWNCEEIYAMVEASPYKECIKMVGYIDGAEKDYLLQHAKCFLYPSLYEGFGIPVLESFAYGIPVITARNSSLPEVGGEAVYYIDTYDANKLAEHMQHVIHLEAEEREQLENKMHSQMSKFSWEKCAEETLQTIEIENGIKDNER